MATPEEIVENAKTTASCLNGNIERCKTGQSNAYSSYRQRFTGKDSHITEERILYKKSNGTEIKLPLYNEKSVDTSPEPSGWIAFVSPSGIKYLPTYSQTNGNMGSKGRYSNIAENRGHVCNLCFSNCNTNYVNCAKCYTGCNECNECQGCQSINSCKTNCNDTCNGCYTCQGCDDCHSGCNISCNSCQTCHSCVGCVKCEGCISPHGLHGTGTCPSCYSSGHCSECYGSCRGPVYACCNSK